ncbi:MAG TPA: GNAT family N-acetyltransferase [Candidatus Acidoferrales bacterium]|nr:GNAT family N-acetyltransferase [Candidatus Acidoferrales bacterium]
MSRLGPSDAPEAAAFLDADPVLNVYLHALVLRDALGRPRDEWWGARRDGRLTALVFLGAHSGAVLPAGTDREALHELGAATAPRRAALPPRFQVIGTRAAVAALRVHFPGPEFTPRLERDQRYLVVSSDALARFERLPELRAARPEDHALVYESGAALRAEELLEDPREIDPVAYARRVEEDCRDGHTYVWRDVRGLVFRASVSARTPFAAQVAGVYTPPALRNQGIARRGLSELCARLFERSQAVCLFVNDVNAPALALYRRLGFVEHAEWASAFFEPPLR